MAGQIALQTKKNKDFRKKPTGNPMSAAGRFFLGGEKYILFGGKKGGTR